LYSMSASVIHKLLPHLAWVWQRRVE
jgi:hypothetical protein